MRRFYEFQCPHGHVSEAFTESENRTIQCKECDETAERIISMPRVKLEGITGDFPGAYHAWERKRNEKIAQDRKKSGLGDE